MCWPISSGNIVPSVSNGADRLGPSHSNEPRRLRSPTSTSLRWMHCSRHPNVAPRKGVATTFKPEMDALLAAPERSTTQGRRDYALLLFLYNTGARADEAAH